YNRIQTHAVPYQFRLKKLMHNLCDHIDDYQCRRSPVTSHKKLIYRPGNHGSTSSEKRQEIEECDQESHKHKVSYIENSKSRQKDQKHNSHNLKLGLKVSANRIFQIIHYQRHSLLHCVRSNLFEPADNIFSLNGEEIG